MPVIPAVNYSAIRSQLQTGDLLAFEGSEPLDIMINLLEEGGYSHVGMVLRDEQDTLWFWDAPGGGLTFTDPYWHGTEPNSGCRVANLDCLLAYYMSNMGLASFTWRKLTPGIPYSPGSPLATFMASAKRPSRWRWMHSAMVKPISPWARRAWFREAPIGKILVSA